MVGAPCIDRAADLARAKGVAFVFSQDASGAWTRREKLVPSRRRRGEWFGYAVAIDGDSILVSAPGFLGKSRRGRVVIFKQRGRTWEEASVIRGDQAGDNFGSALAIANSHLVVAADGLQRFVPFSGSKRGFAFVFRKTSSGVWKRGAELTGGKNWFGQAVATDGKTVVVLSQEEGVYVFSRQDEKWIAEAQLTDTKAIAPVGTLPRVAVEGNTVALGDPYAKEPISHLRCGFGWVGRLHIWQRRAGEWTRQKSLTAPLQGLSAEPNGLGASVAMDGQRLFAGAPDTCFHGREAWWPQQGAIYEFRR